jgi:hypothetical protein
MKSVLAFVRAAVLAAAVLLAAPAMAQEKTGIKPGFTLKPGTARIILMRPSIKVGAQSTGGMFEPNADWTTQARENIGNALATAQATLGNKVVPFDDSTAGDPVQLTQYRNLFSSLADSVIEYQFFRGNRLPTKGRKGQFDWSIGSEVAQLPGVKDADYILFITTEDHFGSTGRKILQVAAMLGGVSVTSGVHKGYAGLIDVKTGQLVWLNADRQMGGDVRTPEGAVKRVGQLLEGFPGQVAATGGVR